MASAEPTEQKTPEKIRESLHENGRLTDDEALEMVEHHTLEFAFVAVRASELSAEDVADHLHLVADAAEQTKIGE